MKKNWNCHFLPTRGKWLKSYWLMRNFIILFFALNLSAFANGLSQEVSLARYENATLIEVFEDIKVQTGYGILYKIQDVDSDIRVNMIVENTSVQEILGNVLEGTNLGYRIKNEVIVIFKSDKISYPKEIVKKQEKKELKGTVTDDKGETLPGVSVVVKGSTIGTATDINGEFLLMIPNDAEVLVFTFVGMVSQEVAYSGQESLNIILKADFEGLDEIVVIGYGTTKKERIGSAISQVDADAIEERSAGAVSIDQIIGGQIKGVQINQSSGAPGSGSTIRVRGITSPFASGNNQPLYVIDGVPFNGDVATGNGSFSGGENPLLSISPSDIENVSVLKDASATAIYGSRGANGVIIVTTKRGKKSSRTDIKLNYVYSISNPLNTQDVLDTDGFKSLHNMIAKNTINAFYEGTASYIGFSDADLIVDADTGESRESIYNLFSGETIPVYGNANTDWQDKIYRENAATHQWNLSFSGGNDKTNYAFALSHTNQEALMINEDFKRYGARLAIDSDVNDWLKIGTSINYSGIKNISGRQTLVGYGSPTDAMISRPDFEVYQEDGSFKRIPDFWQGYGYGMGGYIFENQNPIAGMENKIESKTNSFIGNAYLAVEPIKDLSIKAQVNVRSFNTIGSDFAPTRAQAYDVFNTDRKSMLSNSLSDITNVSTVFQANYVKNINNHFFTLMGGISFDRNFYHSESQTYLGTADDNVLTNTSSASTHFYSRGGKAESGTNSIYSRLQYSYLARYTATVNFRTDESSKFAPGNKRAYFPSFALNWNVANEAFMKDQSFVKQLKLRGSIGQTGSSNVNDFSYLQFFEVGQIETGKYNGQSTIVNSKSFPNKDIKWETTTEYNLGLDFSLLNDRLYGSVDFYNKYTKDVLAPTPIFLEAGSPNFISNLAEISNKGIELDFGGYFIKNGQFSWSADFNIALNRNKVEDINGASLSQFQIDNFIEGEPVGTIKGYRVEKIIQDQAEIAELNSKSPTGVYYKQTTGAGDYLYKDINGDGRITSDDRDIIGNMQPDFFGGFSTTLNYKGLYLFAGFQYSVGNEREWGNYRSLIGSPRVFANMAKEALTDTWTPENTDAKYTRLIYGNFDNASVNDRNIQDASYLRFKILRLGYQVPENLLKNSPLHSVNVFASASNLFTITNYKGLDPEAIGSSFISSGVSGGDDYPFAKTFSLGVTIGF